MPGAPRSSGAHPVRRPSRRLAAAALVVGLGLALGLPLAQGVPPAGGTVSFVFADTEQPPAEGVVLAEFPEALFVRLEGQLPGFLRRAELAAVIDEGGRRIEHPAVGSLAPVARVIPVAAVTEISGTAWLRPARAGGESPRAPEERATDEGPRPGEQALPEQEGGAVFLEAGGAVRTGANGTARGVFPSGAELWLGVGTEVVVERDGGEGLRVAAGEATVESRLRPLRLHLPRPLVAQLDEASRLVVRAEGEVTRFEQHDGQTQLAWPDLSLALPSGHGVDVEELDPGRWRLRASETNPAALDLMAAGTLEQLPPGAERVIGVELLPQGDLWTVLSARGELLVRRGPRGAFVPVQTGPQQVALGRGDALRTAAAGEALLARLDGARLTLRDATHLEVDEALELVRGRALLEALDAPVLVTTPGGVAALDHVVAQLARLGADGGAGLADAFEVEAVAGRPLLPLGRPARVAIDEGGKLAVSREALPADADPRAEAPLALRQLQGKARLRAAPLGERGDAGWAAQLAQGELVRVLPPDDEVEAEGQPPRRPFGGLALEGRRLLRFVAANTEAEVEVGPARLHFPQRPYVELAEGLTLDVGRAPEELPLLRFKSGETLVLRDAVPLRVENPTIEVRGRGARVKLEGGIALRVEQGGAHGAAALGTREADRLELRPQRAARLALEQEQVRYRLDDGRALWIQSKAPPVDARLGDAEGTLFLSMPGAPSLGLRPDRRLTVMATDEGEFVILDQDQLGADSVELLGLDANAPGLGLLERDRLSELLDVPSEVSPSGP
ncbi:MAG: hypothetical protein AB7N76_36865 [Planctomycetota bacterium]